ncbi:MAG: response regulator transcription factor [Taibaiella sp.]|nr:response regulator transcription factor [Taibaiella sp.]
MTALNVQHQQPNNMEPLQQLTLRELEATSLVALDLSDKQIARKMGVSLASVASYIRMARTKLNCATRVGLAVWYVQNYGSPSG